MLRKAVFLLIVSLLISCNENTNKQKELSTKKQINSKESCGPPITDADWYKIVNKAPLLEGLDAIDYPITTKDSLVQRYFNQGMTLAYGFNHAEAVGFGQCRAFSGRFPNFLICAISLIISALIFWRLR